MSAAVCCLGLYPFSWGLQTGVVPKLFGDEVILILYLAAFPFLYLLGARAWRSGFGKLYISLFGFVFLQALSFLGSARDLVAIRNFLETFVLGSLLLVLFLQEGSNSSVEPVGASIVAVTTVIAALSFVELIVQRNPIMEHSTDIFYLSPELARITEGVYRPYVSFFHPSETGTFMALGAPFAIRFWMRRKDWLSTAVLVIIASGLIVNATRGVWVGVTIGVLILFRRARALFAAAVAAAVVIGMIAYLGFGSTPFFQRLTDPNNLYSRFEYWRLAVRIFLAHPMVGVGHMQFKTVYLNYVQDLSNVAQFDIAKVSVVDNMYLTTLVEHGFIGLSALLGLLIASWRLMADRRQELVARGLLVPASFVRCSEVALWTYAVTGFFADVNQFTKATKLVLILVGLGLAAGFKQGDQKEAATAPVERSIPTGSLA
jgi:hypothetical protein